jgi:signal transduction histidine kinase
VLLYFAPVPLPGPGEGHGWTLVVQSDMARVAELLTRFERHLALFHLFLTNAVIAILGFGVLRRVGRLYERSLEAQVRRRTAELEATHAQMLQKTRLAMIGQTASTLAHELRNPLAAIKMGLSGLYTAASLAERERRRLDIALREVDRLDNLLSQTLAYTRPVQLSAEPLPLDRVIDRVVTLVEPLLHTGRIRLARTPCPACPAVRLDPAQMQQALLNLVKNAIEAGAPDGHIDLQVVPHGTGLRLTLRNGGPAIAAADLERVFEPFFTTKPKGTGLGLTLVKRVVEEHGGSITIHTPPSSGTLVTVDLPPP